MDRATMKAVLKPQLAACMLAYRKPSCRPTHRCEAPVGCLVNGQRGTGPPRPGELTT